MSKKKILHIVDLSMIGGLQKVALSVILHQSFRNQYEQSVFNPEKKDIRKLYKINLLHESIQLYESNMLFSSRKKQIRKMALFYTILKVRPHIIMLWSVLPTPILFLIKKLLNIKIVFWDHGVSRHRSAKKSTILSLKRCDLILCNSESTKKLLQKKWSVNNAEVCYNPIRSDVIPEKLPIKSLDKENVTLGFAGRLVPLKGVGLTIEAIQILKKRNLHVKLLIAGAKNEEYSFLKKLVGKFDIEAYVRFLGPIDNMDKFYQSIDIFLCPSLSEPFGLVSVEAASNGCPVIISKIDGLAETVEEGVTGIAITPKMPLDTYRNYVSTTASIPDYAYFPDKKDFDQTKAVYPEEIADSVAQIVQTEGLYKKFSEASYYRSIEKFSINQHINCVMMKLKRL